jgi:hypothetical protein
METTHLETLPFGPLTDRTVHLCIDMQNLFALDTPWHTPWMDRVLPVVARIAERHPARTVLTRFIPPERPDQMPGSWRRYYERWRDLTQERMDPGLIERVPPLRAIAPPAEVIDKQSTHLFSSQIYRRCCADAEQRVSSSPVPKPMSAFWPQCSTRSTSVTALCLRPMRFAARRMRRTTHC